MRFFFFNDTATTEIYTLSLHDALPIWPSGWCQAADRRASTECAVAALSVVVLDPRSKGGSALDVADEGLPRSEEHTSELQSRQYLVCRLLLEKKKTTPLLSRSSTI